MNSIIQHPRRAALTAAAALAAGLPSAAREPFPVRVDPRLELAAFAQLASTEPAPADFQAGDDDISRAAREALSDSDLAAAARLGAMPASFLMQDRAQILLRLSDPPALSTTTLIPESLLEKAGGAEAGERWLDALRQLSARPGWKRWHAAHARRLERAKDTFSEKAGELRAVEALDRYSGLPFKQDLRVALSAFLMPGSIANAVIERPDGGVEIQAAFGASRASGRASFWSRRAPGALWHELAHASLDPLVDAWRQTIDAARPDAGPPVYGEWRQYARECVVRAAMLRLVAREIGPALEKDQIAFERPELWGPALRMAELLRDEYEKDRSAYPTIADFSPRLFQAFAPRPAPPRGAPVVRSLDVRRRLEAFVGAALPRVRTREARARLEALRAELGPPSASTGGERTLLPLAGAGADAVKEAVRLFGERRPNEALAALDSAPESARRHPALLLSRAVVLDALGRASEALSEADRAVGGADGDYALLADALSTRASLRFKSGDARGAREDLGRALEAAPPEWERRAQSTETLKSLRTRR